MLRVSADSHRVDPWYLSDYTPAGASKIKAGLTGIQAMGDGSTLLASDARAKNLVRFDMAADKGTPLEVPIAAYDGSPWLGLDAIYMPGRYGRRVLLVSSNTQGTSVLRRFMCMDKSIVQLDN